MTVLKGSYPVNKRYEIAQLLCAEVFKYLSSGLNIVESKVLCISDKQYLKVALENKLKEDYSDNYKKTLKWVYNRFTLNLKDHNLSSNSIQAFLNQYTKGSSYNTIRKHLGALINEAHNIGMQGSLMKGIKPRKSKYKLHKPYKKVSNILNEVKLYNRNLYVCCIMTYGCLLRPHREIGELSWGDFSDDLKYIHLSGNRNKSGRNRIVPVPSYVRDILVKGEPHHNIFSSKPQPLNQDYFKTLWGRFKKQSNILEQGQTLYSFRHTGAIEIFKRTGTITKLQKAMGHSSINVSLTYLRGLEVTELKEENMPKI